MIGIVRADARRIPLGDSSVDCVVTSPPYWSLRDYGVAPSVWGGGADHSHEWVSQQEREAYTSKTRWQHETNGRGEEQPEEKCLRTKRHGPEHHMTNRPPATDRGYVRESVKRTSTTRETRPEAWGSLTQGSTCACGAWLGVLGLEPSVQLYVDHLVEVFREVRRVLKPSGVLFLNLGDCYASGERGIPCGTSGRVRAGWIDRDWPSFRLCDACAEALFSGSPHSDHRLCAEPPDEPTSSNRARSESESCRPANSDSTLQDLRPHDAMQRCARTSGPGDAQQHASQGSKPSESSGPPQAGYLLSGSHFSGPSSLGSSGHDAQEFARKLGVERGTRQRAEHIASLCGRRLRRTQDIGASCSRCEPRIDSTTASLKAKDLIGLPWRVAFALQADGWWLRSDIIWHKPNPMPESVRDRPTKAHEYLFLLAKSASYYYDADAIREPFKDDSLERFGRRRSEGHKYDGGVGWNGDRAEKWNDRADALRDPNHGATRANRGYDTRDAIPGVRSHRKQDCLPRESDLPEHEGLDRAREEWRARNKTAETPHARGRRQAPEPGEPNAFHPLGRNARSVWTIPTQPYSGSHFATFPEALVRPCVLAGCPREGVVLDPFAGSGTVGRVAIQEGRRAVLCDLAYQDLALLRTNGIQRSLL